MKTFKDLPFKQRERPIGGFDGKISSLTFDNGYGVSVINDGYGKDDGLYELAVLGQDNLITYDTPLTNDVLGHLTEADVSMHMKAVQELKA